MTLISLPALFSYELLNREIELGYVRRQVHPSSPLEILNYSEKAVYERRWNAVTRACRGLIINRHSGEVVARPFEKFFNHSEPGAPKIGLDEPVEVLDKADGSLGILYPVDEEESEFAIATRGSFTSAQAIHATQIWNEWYEWRWTPEVDLTYLFEIVFPENRIVLDYGEFDDLVLLGAVRISTGEYVPAAGIDWPGPRIESYEFASYGDALAAAPRDNAEGYVIRTESGAMVKVKQADYVRLHKLMTQLSARDIWEYVAVDHCRHLIEEPKHWGGRLGIDPKRAEQILAAGDNSINELLTNVPDEFHDWVAAQISKFTLGPASLVADLVGFALPLWEKIGKDRATFATLVAKHEHRGGLWYVVDGDFDSLQFYAFKAFYPEAEKPFAELAVAA